jgi:hypothetical protein
VVDTRGSAPAAVESRKPPDAPAAPPPLADAPLPRPLVAQVVAIDVNGALSPAVVRRAVDRAAGAIRACTPPPTPQTVDVRFSIGESRRPQDVRAVGASPAASCVATALSALRTESAPDVGDASVVVRIAFR